MRLDHCLSSWAFSLIDCTCVVLDVVSRGTHCGLNLSWRTGWTYYLVILFIPTLLLCRYLVSWSKLDIIVFIFGSNMGQIALYKLLLSLRLYLSFQFRDENLLSFLWSLSRSSYLKFFLLDTIQPLCTLNHRNYFRVCIGNILNLLTILL